MSTQVTQSTQRTSEQSAQPPSNTEDATEGSSPTEREDLPLDVVFDILSVERRRRVLRYLDDESETTTLSDLAEHIAAIENDKPEAALSSKERKRVYVGLYQCHLPRMADAGVIDYDSDRGTVERGPTAEDVISYLPAEEGPGDPEDDRPWPTYYLSVALAGAGLFVGQHVLFSHAVVAELSVGLVVATVCLLALLHAQCEGRLPGFGFDLASDEEPA